MFIDITHFTVTRSSWSRGQGKDTCLLNDVGEKDCIGFFFKACGATNAQLLRLDEPIDVIIKYGWNTPLIECVGWAAYQTETCRSIIAINDAPIMNEAQREYSLIRLFKKINVVLEFVD